MDFDFKNNDVNLATYMDGPIALLYDGDTVTRNLGMVYRYPDVLVRPNYIYLNEKDIAGVGKALEESGYGKPLTVFGQPYKVEAGFATYPVYELDFKKLFAEHPEAKTTFLESVNQYVSAFAEARAAMHLNDPYYDIEQHGPIDAEEMGAPALQYLAITDAFTDNELEIIRQSVTDDYEKLQQKIDAIEAKNRLLSPAEYAGEDFSDADFDDEISIPTEIEDFIEDEEEEVGSDYDDYGE